MNLAAAQLQSGQLDAAEYAAREAAAIDPRSADARGLLGVILLRGGNVQEAVNTLRAALDLRPNLLSAQANLARALARSPDGAPATIAFEAVLSMLKPGTPAGLEAARELLWHSGTHPAPGAGKVQSAVRLADRLLARTSAPEPALLDAAAAVYAAAGDYEKALAAGHRAVKRFRDENRDSEARAAEVRCELYERRQPFRSIPNPKPGSDSP